MSDGVDVLEMCRRSVAYMSRPVVLRHAASTSPNIWSRETIVAADPKFQAALALHRFGFGPRPGSIAAIASDPRGAVVAELEKKGAGQITGPDLLSSAAASRAVLEFNAERQAQERLERRRREAQQSMAGPDTAPMVAPSQAAPKPNAPKPPPAPAPLPQRIFLQEAKARIDAAYGAEIGFVERLVWFWSNHFCVSADKVPAMAGAYEREAIRAHVLGPFRDMLAAAEGHPAMLFYLDNSQSIGPNSVAGINRDRGLNENLAREILELHTLGVRSVYSQADVTNFAKVLTGWTIIPAEVDPDHGAEFTFIRRMHEPGPQTVIGKMYHDLGVEQGRAVLADLARHPATAKHVSTKLARHFISDEPASTLVDRVAKRFLETDGNLREVAKALVSAPEAWSAPRSKLKRPGEWMIAALRAAAVAPANIQPLMQAHNLLGEPLWRPPAPKGFDDNSAAWTDGLAQRLDIANQLALRLAAGAAPEVTLEAALGPLASAQTREAIARAATRPQALTLLFMAPEFQRR
jgi:uncharacterized protein (DUF1800 family)